MEAEKQVESIRATLQLAADKAAVAIEVANEIAGRPEPEHCAFVGVDARDVEEWTPPAGILGELQELADALAARVQALTDQLVAIRSRL